MPFLDWIETVGRLLLAVSAAWSVGVVVRAKRLDARADDMRLPEADRNKARTDAAHLWDFSKNLPDVIVAFAVAGLLFQLGVLATRLAAAFF